MYVIGCYFGGGMYRRMAHVLMRTLATHCPYATVDIQELPGPHLRGIGSDPRVWMAANSDKLAYWVERVRALPSYSLAMLVDCDLYVRRDFYEDVWTKPFDVALCRKLHAVRMPYNGGVVFLRINGRSVAFMNRWLETNSYLRANARIHRKWRLTHGGMNQAALGLLLSRGHHARVIDIDAAVVNCCDEVLWKDYRDSAIVHVKGDLRRQLFGTMRETDLTAPILSEWRTLEAQHAT